MFIIDHKYVQMLSNRLDRFTRVNSKTYNFRCPLCGDSRRSTYKTRGYIYEKKDRMLYYCHNCGASISFGNFLKTFDSVMHTEYLQEKFMEKQLNIAPVKPDITQIVWPKYRMDSPLRSLKKISQLDHNHPAKRYVVHRKIPPKFHYKLFYAPKFKSWINEHVPDKFKQIDHDEPRLIIPFLDKQQHCFGIQGRSFKPDGIRYITIMFDESNPKIFGLDTLERDRPVYVLEGPIDSMFVDNAIAMGGSDLPFSYFQDFSPSLFTFVYDNEPRNAQIVKRMENIIERGYNIVIWPPGFDHKDINDMVMAGINHMDVIRQHTCRELQAYMAWTYWKKI